jgi:hypothetical protein
LKDKLLAQEATAASLTNPTSVEEREGRSSLAAAGGSKSVGFGAQIKVQKGKGEPPFPFAARRTVFGQPRSLTYTPRNSNVRFWHTKSLRGLEFWFAPAAGAGFCAVPYKTARLRWLGES